MRRHLLLLAALPAVAFAADKRDPFQPPGEPTPPTRTCLRGTCRFALDELRLVGVVRSAEPVAMVADPSGVGYVIKPGSRVGRERAVVVRIGAGELEVEWTQADGSRTHTTLKLRADEQPEPDDLSKPEEGR